ncbi:hypothetical protein K432DRAFT_424193 [Lepidopterella palustris CBS 459.81]|uniref:Uncharacterized protein n=1 Tax=Lepidopterella palustris CBS 459.81 TaxID=1314670 RepID=A0A8E2EEL0_9PEZI|nr:hypothetical protein K432DRAFT_424193 [Lepidopterella palustris CBS 459.81]
MPPQPVTDMVSTAANHRSTLFPTTTATTTAAATRSPSHSPSPPSPFNYGENDEPASDLDFPALPPFSQVPSSLPCPTRLLITPPRCAVYQNYIPPPPCLDRGPDTVEEIPGFQLFLVTQQFDHYLPPEWHYWKPMRFLADRPMASLRKIMALRICFQGVTDTGLAVVSTVQWTRLCAFIPQELRLRKLALSGGGSAPDVWGPLAPSG